MFHVVREDKTGSIESIGIYTDFDKACEDAVLKETEEGNVDAFYVLTKQEYREHE